MLGLYEQVISTDGLRNAVLEQVSGDIAAGSLCGTGIITEPLCTYIFLSGINKYLHTFKKYLLFFREVLNKYRVVLPSSAGNPVNLTCTLWVC